MSAEILFLIIGLLAGGAVGALLARASRAVALTTASHAGDVRAATLESEKSTLQQQLLQLRGELEQSRHQCQQLHAMHAADQARLDSTAQSLAEQQKLLATTREQLTHEFENLANRIFDNKQETFKQQSTERLESLLNPLREQMTGFQKKVETTYDNESRERNSLVGEIRALKDLNLKMTQEATNLTTALKGDNKVQGNWGEMILERILEQSGLEKGREYELQVALRDESGKRRNPDVIIRLPEGKDVVVDSKVSLVDYERYVNAADDAVRQLALTAHIQSLKTHVRNLALKDYEQLQGIRTLDFVLIFVPIEAAFLSAVQQDTTLFQEAFDRGIILVSPSTLLATLRTIHSIWRYERQNRHADEIANEAGKLHDALSLMLDDLSKVAQYLQKAQDAYGDTVKRIATGKGHLIGRVDKLRVLGARTKRQLPSAFTDQAAIDAEVDADNSDPV